MSDKKPTPPSFKYDPARVVFGNVTLGDLLNGIVLTTTELNAISVGVEPPTDKVNDENNGEKDGGDKQQ